MSIQKRLIYMAVGGLLALSVFIGAFAVFAQSGEGEDPGTTTAPEVETDPGTAENSSESSSTESAAPHGFFGLPGFGERGFDARGFGERGFAENGRSEDLANALGISVEELQAAYQTAAEAAVQQAVDEGLLTQDQADALSAHSFEFHSGAGLGLHIGDIDFDALVADALGISVDDLQAARDEVFANNLAQQVEDGVITQEQADMIQARKAVQDYVDTDAISSALQSAYESAVNDALAAGAITQDQADLMLENMPSFDGMGLGFGGGPHGFNGPGPGGHGFHGGPGGGQANGFAPSFQAPAVTESSGA
ncbi:MAG: hypothetical protein WAM60_18750 [Candidatus Promineifilaceae bacterium]